MFYVRKSIKVGPLRFNLSKSGVGTSIGVRGARLGVGPRGSYVHIGRAGIYYKQYLTTSRSSSKGTGSGAQAPSSPKHMPSADKRTVEELEEIASADVAELSSADLSDFVRQIEESAKRINWWPWLIAGLAILTVLVPPQSGRWQTSLYALGGAVITLAACRWWLVLPKFRFVVFYDFDADQQNTYQQLFDASNELARSKRVWNITASGDVLDKKYHAGAGKVMSRQQISVSFDAPKRVSVNTPIIKMPAGRETLYLFPDHLHVVSSAGHAAISYKDLSVDVVATQFIEDQGVPSDAKVVGRTWRYVNRNGGPDRRFKDNHEIPIAEYAALEMWSSSGLREVFHVSSRAAAEAFCRALTQQKHSVIETGTKKVS